LSGSVRGGIQKNPFENPFETPFEIVWQRSGGILHPTSIPQEDQKRPATTRADRKQSHQGHSGSPAPFTASWSASNDEMHIQHRLGRQCAPTIGWRQHPVVKERREISESEWLIDGIGRNGVASTAAEGLIRPCRTSRVPARIVFLIRATDFQRLGVAAVQYPPKV